MTTEIPLTDRHLSVMIHEKDNTVSSREIVIRNGKYEDQYYTSILLTENNIILQGPVPLLISTEARYITLHVKTIKEFIQEVTGSPDVFITGIHAIPEGAEKEIISAIMD